MANANVNDRATVEAAYPREAFDQDVGRNSEPKAIAFHGVRIDSEPDASGAFSLVRASRHVGEEEQRIHSVFLAPTRSYGRSLEQGATPYGEDGEQGDGVATEVRDSAAVYRAFIDQVIEAARSVHFQELDPQDARLKGFHGG